MIISKQKQGMTDVHKQMDESLVMFISLKEARWEKKPHTVLSLFHKILEYTS